MLCKISCFKWCVRIFRHIYCSTYFRIYVIKCDSQKEFKPVAACWNILSRFLNGRALMLLYSQTAGQGLPGSLVMMTAVRHATRGRVCLACSLWCHDWELQNEFLPSNTNELRTLPRSRWNIHYSVIKTACGSTRVSVWNTDLSSCLPMNCTSPKTNNVSATQPIMCKEVMPNRLKLHRKMLTRTYAIKITEITNDYLLTQASSHSHFITMYIQHSKDLVFCCTGVKTKQHLEA